MKDKLIQKSGVIFGNNEKEVVEKFHHLLTDKFKDKTLGGFNISGFDNQQVLFKMIKHDLQPLPIFEESKYKTFDVMNNLNMFSQGKGKLDDYLKAFGIGEKYNGYNGGDVEKLYKEGKFCEIKKYSLIDAELELQLIRKVLPFFKTKLKITDILAYDIETITDPNANLNVYLVSEDEAREQHIANVMAKNYKKQETIDKNIALFDYQPILDKYNEDVEKAKKSMVFSKFHNKIVSISYSWFEYNEEVF